MHKENILLFGISNKAGRTAAEQLYKKNYCVDVVEWRDAEVKHSKYVSEYFLVHNPEISVKRCFEELKSVLSKKKYRYVIPVTDGAIEIALQYKSEIRQLSTLILNDTPHLRVAKNKNLLLTTAVNLGVQIPQTVVIKQLSDFYRAADRINYPCVLKPANSAKIMGDKLYLFKVSFCKNEQELLDKIRELINTTELLIQEKLEGFGVGFNSICVDGKIKLSYVHKRLFQIGTVSSSRITLPSDAYGLSEISGKLLSELNWNGISMLEYIIAKDNKPYLMEMNCRYYGSMFLAEKLELQYSTNHVNAILGNDLKINRKEYKQISAQCFHDEFLYFLSKCKNPSGVFFFFSWFFKSFVNVFNPNHFFEYNFIKDPGFVFSLYRYDLKRIWKRRRYNKQLRNARFETFAYTPDIKLVVFVCYGNICRSPFAEAYLKKINKEIDIHSCGVYLHNNRMPPTNAVNAAKAFEVDIENHLSKTVHELSQADVYVAMEMKNAIDLYNLGIPASKIKLLTKNRISDPYGKPLDEFEKTYSLIAEAINKHFKQ